MHLIFILSLILMTILWAWFYYFSLFRWENYDAERLSISSKSTQLLNSRPILHVHVLFFLKMYCFLREWGREGERKGEKHGRARERERERERERDRDRDRDRERYQLSRTPQLGTWPGTQACALTGNPTGGPLVRRPALSPRATPARADVHFQVVSSTRIHRNKIVIGWRFPPKLLFDVAAPSNSTSECNLYLEIRSLKMWLS